MALSARLVLLLVFSTARHVTTTNVLSVTSHSTRMPKANVCSNVLNKDSGETAESPMPLLLPLIGAVSVLPVTKVQMPVLNVLDLPSKTVPDVKVAGSKMVPTAVSNVILSVLSVLVLLIPSAQLVLLDSSSIKAPPVLLLAQMDSMARMSVVKRPVSLVLTAAVNVPPPPNVKPVQEDSN